MLSAGRLLVSTPSLVDPNFVQTVVLIIEHDENAGSLGVVLNRPTGLDLADAIPTWTEVGDEPPEVFGGGPVEPHVAVALGRRRVGAGTDDDSDGAPAEVADRVEIVDLDGDPVLATSRYEVIRVYSGYSGWGPGQLRSELDEGAWFVLDSEASDIFTTEPAELWREVLGRQPDELSQLRHFPDDVDLN